MKDERLVSKMKKKLSYRWQTARRV